MRIFRWLPFPDQYGRQGFRADFIAGLTLSVLLVPQAMAYGMLAGVPAVYGLYAALVPMLVYTLLASTPHVSVGPTALASLLCLNGLSGLAEPGSTEYLRYAIVLAAMTGLIQAALGLLRLGAIGSLLSRPVLSGFVSAAAVLIMLSQIDVLLGIELGSGSMFHESLWALVTNLGSVDWNTAFLGFGSLGVLLLGKRWLPASFPTMLVLIAVTTLALWWSGGRWGIATVGEVPSGFPGLSLPRADAGLFWGLLPTAIVLALISFIESFSIGKTFGPRYDYYRVLPNRELWALGLSKLAGAFFQAIPTSASFSRSAVVESIGAKSPLSGMVAVMVLGLVLLFLTPLFEYLPIPVLAAIIIYSVRNLFDWREMRRLWHLSRKEFVILLITCLFTLFAGLQYGVLGGVVLSLIFTFIRAARPHLAELGRIPGTHAFRNRKRFPEAEIDPRMLIVRFDAELYFGNADYFRQELEKLVEQRGEELRAVIIDAHTINDLDTSGLFALEQFQETLQARKTPLYLCGMIGPVRDMLYKSGLMARMGADRHFLSIQAALDYINSDENRYDWDRPALQHD
ncbi:SulP family inorganic anion transporter [Lewinella sp. W8]|uniref:SulP family inorganic anion transporter n=1 Tax=Lewinella sp. W8 TaxID=2528208 RepID=UPI001068D22B|nr:sulfate permease [Lewinella sp. W8]MTB52404.1 sulfate permease [Lewinella sp. W8]